MTERGYHYDRGLYRPAFPVIWKTNGESGKIHSLVRVPKDQPVAMTYTRPNGEDQESMVIDITMIPNTVTNRWHVYGTADLHTLISFNVINGPRATKKELTQQELELLKPLGHTEQIDHNQFNVFWQLSSRQLYHFFEKVWQPSAIIDHQVRLNEGNHRILPEKIPLTETLKRASLRVKSINMSS